MKTTVDHVGFGSIEFEENFWTGKKSVIQNGQPAPRVDKKTFALSDGERTQNCRVKGGFAYGARLITEDGEEISLVPPLAWYEYLLCAFTIMFYSVWSNSVALCNIFPVLGGIAGAFIAGGCIGIGFAFSRMVRSEGIKALIWVGAFFATMLLNSAIAVCIIIA